MVSVLREILIEAAADDLWSVIRDFGTGPSRMAPGFVIGTRVEDDARVVTFANGSVVRERLIGLDDEARRIAYSIIGGSLRPTHDSSSMQVFAEEPGCSRFVWVHDVLPDELAPQLAVAMEQGLKVVKETFESGTA